MEKHFWCTKNYLILPLCCVTALESARQTSAEVPYNHYVVKLEEQLLWIGKFVPKYRMQS